MTIIYQPKGRAREYAEWAANLYTRCPHACAYCFVPSMPWVPSKYQFHQGSTPKKDILDRLRKSAEQQPERRLVHLCFTCDPLPAPCSITSDEDPWLLTRHAINILKDAGHGVQILSKGGMDSLEGLDLLDERDEYATTLTLDNTAESRLWEPFAAPPDSRVSALEIALSYGIQTWASFEPIIFPDQTLTMLQQALDVGISKAKFGPLNYVGRLPKWLQAALPEHVDWPSFVATAQEMCGDYRVECILKKDLEALIA